MENLVRSNEGKKNDLLDKKLRWDLLPLKEVEDIVEVYTKGAEKYGDNNWQNLPNGVQRYKAALLRHLVEFEKGEDVDKETGCLHLAQVAWNAIAMLYLSKRTTNEICEKTYKCDKLIEALDKRIEEKIDSCNKVLDEIESNNSLIELGYKLRESDTQYVNFWENFEERLNEIEDKVYNETGGLSQMSYNSIETTTDSKQYTVELSTRGIRFAGLSNKVEKNFESAQNFINMASKAADFCISSLSDK